MTFKYLTAVTDGVTKTVDLWVGEKKDILASISELLEVKKAMKDNVLIPQIRTKISTSYPLIKEKIFFTSPTGELLNHNNLEQELINLDSASIRKIIKNSNQLYVYRTAKTEKLAFILMKQVYNEQGNILGYVGFITNWDDFIKKFITPVTVGETGYLAITDSKGRNIGHHDSSFNLKSMNEYAWMQKIIKEKTGTQAYNFRGVDKLMAFQESEHTKWIINASINEDELIEGTIKMRNTILFGSFSILIIVIFSVTWITNLKLQLARKDLLEKERNLKLLFRCSNDGDLSECSVFSTCLINAFERGNDSVFIHRIKSDGSIGAFLKVNDSFLHFFNCSLKEISTMTPDKIMSKTIKNSYNVLFQKITSEKVYTEELETIMPGGFVEMRLFKIRTNNQLAILGFVRDITDRVIARHKLREDRDYLDEEVKKRTSEILSVNHELRNLIIEKDGIAKALSQSENRYRSLIDRANDGIMLIDNGKIHFVNKKICSLLRYKPTELTGTKFKDIIIKEDRKRITSEHKRRLQGSITSLIFETGLLSKMGEKVEVEINSGIIYENDLPQDFLFVRDIRLRKRHEEEQRIQKEQMVQTDKLAALGTMLTGVAHEINNPNNAIMLNSPIIKKAWNNIDPVLQKFNKENGDFIISGMPYSYLKNFIIGLIDDIYKSSERIKNIVEELKNFAKPDTSTLYDRVSINEIVQSSVKLMISHIRKATKNFYMDLDKYLPDVYGSFIRLEQVVVNLLQNACHALESIEGNIIITTSYIVEEQVVQIEIKDEGCGISEENLKQIFDPFFTTKRGRGGTGLGLSVSLKIIKEHQGILTLISKEGEGTIATIKLPNKKRKDYE